MAVGILAAVVVLVAIAVRYGHCGPYGRRSPYRRHGMSSCGWSHPDSLVRMALRE